MNYINDIKLNDFSNWRSGHYTLQKGIFEGYKGRICLNDYEDTEGEITYTIGSSDAEYHILIRELDANKGFIKSYDLSDGEEFTTNAKTRYLGISIYIPKKYPTYNDYEKMFASGYTVSIQKKADIEETVNDDIILDDEDEEEDIIIVGNAQSPSSSTDDISSDAFKRKIVEMLIAGDNTKHDISKYKLTFPQVDALYNEAMSEDGIVAFNTIFNLYYSITQYNGIVQTFKYENIDSEFLTRYKKMNDVLNEIDSGIDSTMTDMDKVLYVHDYIVSHASYSKSGNLTYTASGILVNGQGLCAGYARAMIVVLKRYGIDTCYVSANSMEHAWVMVKLGNEWYHIDSTWDDTRTQISGQTSHQFLLRSDDEFLNSRSNKHYGWTTDNNIVCTSNAYSNWFAHDVVGDMIFKDGYWFYMIGNSIYMARGRDSSEKQVKLVDGSETTETIKIKSVENGCVTYTKGSKELSIIVGTSQESSLSFNKYNLSDISIWKSGTFSDSTYAYISNSKRICINEDIPCDKAKFYRFRISDDNYKINIKEMMGSYRVSSYTLSDGDIYKPSSNMTAIRISLIAANENNKTFDSYVYLFNEGIDIWFNTIEPKVYDETSLKDEIRQMYLTCDCSIHDISRYNVKYSVLENANKELSSEDEDVKFVHKCGFNIFTSTTSNSKGILQTLYLKGMDGNIPEILQKSKDAINEICSFVQENDMTDLDKILYVHEELAKRTVYTLSETSISQGIGNLLANGKSVCAGYASTTEYLLNRLGVKCVYVSGNSGNHAWNLVEINGNWYHYDTTWDDKDCKNGVDVIHTYLLRNDSEWISTTALPSKHWGWYVGSSNDDQSNYKSKDTSFTDWAIHDIKNIMTYYDGYWYYVTNDNKNIMRCKSDCSMFEVVKEFDDTVIIESVKNGYITYRTETTVDKISLEFNGMEYEEFVTVLKLQDNAHTKSLYQAYVSCLNEQ